MTIADILRRTRHDSKLSLDELAARSGVAKSSLSLIENGRRDPTAATIERVLAAQNTRLFAQQLNRATVDDLAHRISLEIGADDWGRAYRTFIQVADNLDAEHGIPRLLLALNEPQRISAEWDAALAGVVEWRLNAELLPVPDWVSARAGDARWSWAPRATDSGWRHTPDPNDIPPELLRRGIHIDAEELTSA